MEPASRDSVPLQKRKEKKFEPTKPRMIESIYFLQQQFLVGELDMSHAALCTSLGLAIYTNLSDGQMQHWNLVQG